MKKKNNLKKNVHKKKKIKTYDFRWIATSIIVPIILGIVTSYIAFKMDKPKEYIIREETIMDNFKVEDYFPLKKGNYWIYERELEYRDEDNSLKKRQEEIKCKVIDFYKYDQFKLFVIKGDPFLEPVFDKRDANSVVYGYISLSNKVVKVPDYKIKTIIARFKDKMGFKYEDFERLQIDFEFPLFDKQRYGDFDQLWRKDAKNTVFVKKLVPYKQKIGDTVTDVDMFTLNKLYNSGDSELTFIPYKGIAAYRYEHIGTTYKIKFHLKESKLIGQ